MISPYLPPLFLCIIQNITHHLLTNIRSLPPWKLPNFSTLFFEAYSLIKADYRFSGWKELYLFSSATIKKYHKLGSLIEMYSFEVWKVRSPNSRCQQSLPPATSALGKNHPWLFFLPSGNCWLSLAFLGL